MQTTASRLHPVTPLTQRSARTGPPVEGDLPEKVDLRPYMTDVEDQASSNSCCANAVAGAYEYLCKRKAIETGDTVGDISRLFIYYVGRKNDQIKYGEDTTKAPKDEGMTLGGAIDSLQKKGACLMEQVLSWSMCLTLS